VDLSNSASHEESVYLERYRRETFLPEAGRRSRAIVPGDDPGDQQPEPEQREFRPDSSLAVPGNRPSRTPPASAA